LDINFYCFNLYVFIASFLIPAHSHINIISGGPWQLLVEPWRVVEGAACVLRPTTSTIPQRVTIIDYMFIWASTACITEIVIAYKCWRLTGTTSCGSVGAGTIRGRITTSFIKASYERP
jgi:hypothetical protein